MLDQSERKALEASSYWYKSTLVTTYYVMYVHVFIHFSYLSWVTQIWDILFANVGICVDFQIWEIIHVQDFPLLCSWRVNIYWDFLIKFSYLNPSLSRYFTVVWRKVMAASVLWILVLHVIVSNVQAGWEQAQDNGRQQVVWGVQPPISGRQQAQSHCLWEDLQQRFKRDNLGNGFNIFFNYATCPNGPDPFDLSCVRKGQRRDSLQFHPCCGGYSTTLPNCQEL